MIMEITPHSEIMSIVALPDSIKKKLLYGGVASIGAICLGKAQLEVSLDYETEYDQTKIFTGLTLLTASGLTYAVDKFYHAYITREPPAPEA